MDKRLHDTLQRFILHLLYQLGTTTYTATLTLRYILKDTPESHMGVILPRIEI